MKNNDIKKAFDPIKADELMKSRILNNVHEELEKNNRSKLNRIEGIYMKNKKLVSVLAASVVLVGGVFLYNKQDSNITNPPISSPPVGREYVPEQEFNNFDIENLKDKTRKIEIKNHVNSHTFKEISSKEFINNALDYMGNIKEKELTDKVFEDIGQSQAEGNSITMSFITEEGEISSIRVNLDLNIVCINEKYYDVSSEFIGSIKEELKTVKDFNEMNNIGQY